MADHDDHGDHGDDGHGDHDHGDAPYATERTTAPQSDYTARDVAVGALVAAVGIVVVFGIPLALA